MKHLAWSLLAMCSLACGAQMRIVLAGTGGPELTAERSGIATVMETRGQTLLIDVGRGALDSLYQSHVDPRKVTKIFLTHLHNDHIEGLPTLWITPWFLLSRNEPLEVWGPEGTAAMIDGMRMMYAHDIEHRSNALFKRDSLDITVHEVKSGVAYERDEVSVMAIPVEHADGNPALAYLVTSSEGKVLLTGDCTFGEELVRVSGHVDVAISNVAAGTAELEKTPRMKPILGKLMRPELAATLFNATTPRLAVFSHIVKKGLSGEKGDAEILRRTHAAGYRGRLIMGSDHTEITVGKTILVRQIASPLPDFDGPDSHF